MISLYLVVIQNIKSHGYNKGISIQYNPIFLIIVKNWYTQKKIKKKIKFIFKVFTYDFRLLKKTGIQLNYQSSFFFIYCGNWMWNVCLSLSSSLGNIITKGTSPPTYVTTCPFCLA